MSMTKEEFLTDFFKDTDEVVVNAVELQKVYAENYKLILDVNNLKERCLIAENRNKELLDKLEFMSNLCNITRVDLRG